MHKTATKADTRLAADYAASLVGDLPTSPRAALLSWSDAMSLAPWPHPGVTCSRPLWRRLVAGALVELGVARRAGEGSGPSGDHSGVSVTLRMTPAERARLQGRARKAGESLQRWAMGRLLGAGPG